MKTREEEIYNFWYKINFSSHYLMIGSFICSCVYMFFSWYSVIGFISSVIFGYLRHLSDEKLFWIEVASSSEQVIKLLDILDQCRYNEIKKLIENKEIDISIEDLEYYFFVRKNYSQSLETNKRYQSLHEIINPYFMLTR